MDNQVVELLHGQEPGRAVVTALMKLLANDSVLLEIDVNERTITHRLAMYLQEEIPDLDVDCEYNRDGVNPKRLRHLGLDPDDEDAEGKTAFPDIIVHRRKSRHNYLVIEVKKTTNRVERAVDFAKLEGYKRDLGFGFALFIELLAGERAGVSQVMWV